MAKFIVVVDRKKRNVFEIDREDKKEAERIVRYLVLEKKILEHEALNDVPTEVTFKTKKVKTEE